MMKKEMVPKGKFWETCKLDLHFTEHNDDQVLLCLRTISCQHENLIIVVFCEMVVVLRLRQSLSDG